MAASLPLTLSRIPKPTGSYTRSVYLIALTGGIGAGKSTIAKRLEQHGAILIDADVMARDTVSAGSETLAAIAREFGQDVLNESGALDRPKLGAIVFNDPEQLSRLNAIVHPAVKRLTESTLNDLRTSHPDAIVVHEIPLLIEADLDYGWDLIVVAMADEPTRLQRLVHERGMTEPDALDRIQRQTNDDERRRVAHVLIHTDGSIEETIQQTDELWNRIQNTVSTGA